MGSPASSAETELGEESLRPEPCAGAQPRGLVALKKWHVPPAVAPGPSRPFESKSAWKAVHRSHPSQSRRQAARLCTSSSLRLKQVSALGAHGALNLAQQAGCWRLYSSGDVGGGVGGVGGG